MDRLVAHFDRVSERVNHASYGYSGFFDTVKIKEDDLDRMIDFDNQLVDSAAKMVDEATAFKTDLTEQKFDTAKQHIQTLFEALEAFEQAFDKRRETIIMES
jgi:phage-related minor tail protein